MMYETAYIHVHGLWNTEFYRHLKTLEELVAIIMPQWAEPWRHTVVSMCVCVSMCYFFAHFFCTAAELGAENCKACLTQYSLESLLIRFLI